MTDRYLDDLTVGESWDSEPFTMTEAEIIAFATEFDPQPMHIDKAGGRGGAVRRPDCQRLARLFARDAAVRGRSLFRSDAAAGHECRRPVVGAACAAPATP
jgi:hypothetical protein